MATPGTCIITGGARGIGRATARQAAAAGWSVAVGYRERADAAEALVGELGAKGARAAAIQADVAVEADIIRLFERAERELGPVRGLVNSAGIAPHAAVADLALDELQRLFTVNVLGLMLCCREAARRMSTTRGGSGGAIVNVSSMAATTGGRPQASAYAASKGAVDVFTMGFAREVAREGIRVNVVRPGLTLTDMTAAVRDDPARLGTIAASIPMGRAGEAHEVAAAIVWLLSDQASFVTGDHLNVGGGGFMVGPATQ